MWSTGPDPDEPAKKTLENLLTGTTSTATVGSDRGGTGKAAPCAKAHRGKLVCFWRHRSVLSTIEVSSRCSDDLEDDLAE